MPAGIYDRSHLIKPLSVRFGAKWKKETGPRGCWVWIGSKNKKGYGLIQAGTHDESDCRLAPRVSWELYRGPIPDLKFVLHHCDNPACVNPDHLFLGDHLANMQDMTRKGRNGFILHPESCPRGENHGNSKLTEEGVRRIRKLLSEGVPVRQTARVMGVNRRTISFIRDGRTWRHIL